MKDHVWVTHPHHRRGIVVREFELDGRPWLRVECAYGFWQAPKEECCPEPPALSPDELHAASMQHQEPTPDRQDFSEGDVGPPEQFHAIAYSVRYEREQDDAMAKRLELEAIESVEVDDNDSRRIEPVFDYPEDYDDYEAEHYESEFGGPEDDPL